MAVLSREVLMSCPPERLFDVITDYAHYPEFVPGVKRCRVLPGQGPRDVEYEVDLGLKRVKYVLRHVEQRPERVSWSLVSGEMFKVSNGSWTLKPEGTGTRATYQVEVQINKPALVPQSIIDTLTDELTRVQLPKNVEAFQARAEGRSP